MYFEWSTLKVLLPSITWKQKAMECHWKHIPLEATKSLCVSVFGKCTKSKVIWLVVDEMTSYDARLNNILLASEMLWLVLSSIEEEQSEDFGLVKFFLKDYSRKIKSSVCLYAKIPNMWKYASDKGICLKINV